MNIALVPNLTKKDSFSATMSAYEKLGQLGATCLFEDIHSGSFPDCKKAEFLPSSLLYEQCDIVIAIGGDGSIMHAAKHAALHRKPILGISTGFLAFMADLEKTEIDLLENLLEGNYSLEKRIMLKASIFQNSKLIGAYYCVNDAVFARGGRMSLTRLTVECDGNFVNEYRADGLIFSTPTGSTAYSLSSGGALADPSSDCVLLTPIASHSLTSRPLIFRADSELKVYLSENAKNEVFFSCDGEGSLLFDKNSYALIQKADITVDFIKIKKKTFWDTLYEKFFKY